MWKASTKEGWRSVPELITSGSPGRNTLRKIKVTGN
jgi:hypothetical protein